MGKEKAGVERDGDVLCTSRTEEGGAGERMELMAGRK